MSIGTNNWDVEPYSSKLEKGNYPLPLQLNCKKDDDQRLFIVIMPYKFSS